MVQVINFLHNYGLHRSLVMLIACAIPYRMARDSVCHSGRARTGHSLQWLISSYYYHYAKVLLLQRQNMVLPNAKTRKEHMLSVATELGFCHESPWPHSDRSSCDQALDRQAVTQQR